MSKRKRNQARKNTLKTQRENRVIMGVKTFPGPRGIKNKFSMIKHNQKPKK